MKVIHQLIRQPLKSIFGIMLVSAAIVALCVGVGQAFALEKTQKEMDETFATVAIQKADANGEQTVNVQGYDIYGFTKRVNHELSRWIEQVAEKHPEVVKGIARQGVASAYVPELKPDNYAAHAFHTPYQGTFQLSWFGYNLSPYYEGMPYSGAMLEITLEEIGEPSEEAQHDTFITESVNVHALEGWRVELRAKVESVVGLQEGFVDPTGMTLQLTIPLENAESWDSERFRVGKRYLVYGVDYFDLDRVLRGYFSDGLVILEYGQRAAIDFDAFNPSFFRYLEGEELERAQRIASTRNAVAVYNDGRYMIYLQDYQVAMFRTVSLTLDRQSYFEQGRTEYSLPTIVQLDGTVEEFLATEEGEIWQETLDNMAVNNQAFPVIGVDQLNYVAEFAKQRAEIVEGRDFTKEELEAGAKVCLISKSLAEANGVAIGDVITPQFYNYDKNIHYLKSTEEGYGTTNPSAWFYISTTPLQEEQEYAVIGFYQTATEWKHYDTSENVHSFTPNTIFAPKKSITSDMQYGVQGVLQTLILQHGATEEFAAIANESGYGDYFEYYDQGYSAIKKNLFDFQKVSQLVLKTGSGIYGVIMILFLLFFPATQGKVLYTMGSLGNTRAEKVGYVFKNSIGILLPGTLIGLVIGLAMWNGVIGHMMKTIGAMLDLEPDIQILVLLVVIQVLLVCGVITLISLWMTREKGLSRHKR